MDPSGGSSAGAGANGSGNGPSKRGLSETQMARKRQLDRAKKRVNRAEHKTRLEAIERDVAYLCETIGELTRHLRSTGQLAPSEVVRGGSQRSQGSTVEDEEGSGDVSDVSESTGSETSSVGPSPSGDARDSKRQKQAHDVRELPYRPPSPAFSSHPSQQYTQFLSALQQSRSAPFSMGNSHGPQSTMASSGASMAVDESGMLPTGTQFVSSGQWGDGTNPSWSWNYGSDATQEQEVSFGNPLRQIVGYVGAKANHFISGAVEPYT